MAKIYWAGKSCFEISVSNSKDHSADVIIDPLREKTADILLLTNKNNTVKTTKGESFLIDGPGEYEVKGVFVQGIPAWNDNKEGENIIYVIEAEDIRFCHLKELGQKQLTDEQLEKIGTVDILMISAGEDAQKIIGQIEPKMVIPMDCDDISKFLKAMGKPTVAAQDKLVIKSSALPKEGALEIVVLQP